MFCSADDREVVMLDVVGRKRRSSMRTTHFLAAWPMSGVGFEDASPVTPSAGDVEGSLRHRCSRRDRCDAARWTWWGRGKRHGATQCYEQGHWPGTCEGRTAWIMRAVVILGRGEIVTEPQLVKTSAQARTWDVVVRVFLSYGISAASTMLRIGKVK